MSLSGFMACNTLLSFQVVTNADLRCLQTQPGGADDHIIGKPNYEITKEMLTSSPYMDMHCQLGCPDALHTSSSHYSCCYSIGSEDVSSEQE